MKPLKHSLFYWFGFLGVLAWITCSVGCAAKKQFEKSQTITDSISYKKTIQPKDTVIKVPEIQVQTKATQRDLEGGKIFTNTNGNITSTLKKEGDSITCDCKQKEYEMIFRLQNELIELYKSRQTDNAETTTTTEYRTPWYAKALSFVGIVFILIIIYRLFLKK